MNGISESKGETSMASSETGPLDIGDPFPALNVKLIDGQEANLPAFLGPGWGVFLIYRAHW